MKQIPIKYFKPTKVRIIRVKDNATFVVKSIKEASQITNVNESTIQKNINLDNKIFNGYKFYKYG